MNKAKSRSLNNICIRAAKVAILCTLLFPVIGFSQGENEVELRRQATVLISENKYTEALPQLKKLAELQPDDAWVQYHLGLAFLGQSKVTTDAKMKKEFLAAARNAFMRAYELGDKSQLVQAIIENLSVDETGDVTFTSDPIANSLMEKGEAAFVQGKMDEAFGYYQAALKIDPKLYYAALFSGDVHLNRGNFDEAEKWYQAAIKIDPNIETAYRYSATPLMKQGKFQEARDRYVEAYITAPYNRLAIGGLVQWGNAVGTQLAHPKIDPPTILVGEDGKIKSTINLSTEEDGSFAWIGYTSVRTNWYEKKFRESFPNEAMYRHSLQEEAEAFRTVLKLIAELKVKPKKLNPQIKVLQQLETEGLLEAYILMARGDEGIVNDHLAYLKSNRDKLRQYVIKYVIQKNK